MKTTTKPPANAIPLVKFSVRLPDQLLEEVQVRAARERRTQQDLVADALEAYLKTPLKRAGDAR
jgi:metal-responsive CopG/Arc/MetJ family transcriptional regulator